MIVFDIETGPLPIEQIRPLMPPFDGEIAPFDINNVRIGNLKDPAKIQEKIRAAMDAHEAEVAALPAKREQHEKSFIERAALSPLTGQVLAIGFKGMSDNRSISYVGDGVMHDEKQLIYSFWRMVESGRSPLVGHNIFGFDLPFLVRRSWLLEIDVPTTLLTNGRFWSPAFIDLMQVWGCGSRGEMIALDTLAKAMGINGKPEGIDGGDFARLLHGTPFEKQQAISYLKNDLEMTWHVATKLQIA